MIGVVPHDPEGSKYTLRHHCACALGRRLPFDVGSTGDMADNICLAITQCVPAVGNRLVIGLIPLCDLGVLKTGLHSRSWAHKVPNTEVFVVGL